jgi:DME family drug/metabolite transporter
VALAGVCCALAAGASYAIFTAACAAVIRRGGDSRTTMAVVFPAAGLALAPALLANPPGWLLTGPGVAVIGYLAAVSTVGAYLLYGHGLRTVGPATAGTLTLAEAPCATVIGVLVLREPLTGPGLAGLILLVIALLALSVPWPRRPSGRSTSTVRRLRAGNTLG